MNIFTEMNVQVCSKQCKTVEEAWVS